MPPSAAASPFTHSCSRHAKCFIIPAGEVTGLICVHVFVYVCVRICGARGSRAPSEDFRIEDGVMRFLEYVHRVQVCYKAGRQQAAGSRQQAQTSEQECFL